jgi:hypothetical protein
MDKFKTVAELTFEDIQELLDDNFESYVLTGKYNDPNSQGEVDYITLGKGTVYDQLGLFEYLKDRLEIAREESIMSDYTVFFDTDSEEDDD